MWSNEFRKIQRYCDGYINHYPDLDETQTNSTICDKDGQIIGYIDMTQLKYINILLILFYLKNVIM